MWTYLMGPIVAIFPEPWRNSLRFAENVQWERATAISGLLEAALGLVGLMYWYSYAMALWVGNGVGHALSGNMGPELRVQDIGGAALMVWAMHPVTWLIGYFGLEGAVRFCTGAFGGTACGILPLCFADKAVSSLFRRRNDAAGHVKRTGGNAASFANAVRERVRAARRTEVPDELQFTKDESGEILDIRSCRRKQDWTPPRTVHYLDGYYRLETNCSAVEPRPFRYRLRRLPVGVPGRTVLLYVPSPDAVIRDEDSCEPRGTSLRKLR
jgi:hypothetical protein